MNLIHDYFHILSHLDVYITQAIAYFGVWTYVFLFLIIFCECGLVLTPFLPGESLLFALGTLAARGALELHFLAILLMSAAILGGFLNYFLGFQIGEHLIPKNKDSIFNLYLRKTHDFYERHGAMTIIIARLVPVVRTYAPFVAGIARMSFMRFLVYNIVGGVLWIAFFLYVSYHFGNIPIIKNNFSIVIFAIIVLSIIPGIVELFRNYLCQKKT